MTHLTSSQVRARETGMLLQSLFALGIMGVVIYNHPIILAYMVATLVWFFASGLVLGWLMDRSWWKVAAAIWLLSPLLAFVWGPVVLMIFVASVINVCAAFICWLIIC